MRAGQTGGSPALPQNGRISPDLVALYRQQERRIYRLCLSYLRNASDAEDATQETFVRAARRLEQLSGDPCAYLTAVARNVCCDDLRRRGRASDATRRGVHLPDSPSDAETEVLARATLEGVWLNLQRHEREMLLQTFAGYSYDEISRRSGLSIPAVASIISRARQRARRAAEVVASLLIPVVVLRRLQNRVRTANVGTGIGTLGLQSSALVGSMMSCLVAGTLTTAPPAAASVELAQAGSGLATGIGRAPLGGLLADGASTRHWRSGAPRGLDAATGNDTGAHATTPLGMAGSILAPPPAQQQDAAFDDVQPSPHYAQDGTLFASGTVVRGCRQGACPALFRSTDHGVSWQQVSASGFSGGSILLPPDFPANPTVFAMSHVGLARSDDGGRTFVAVSPVYAPAAIAPDSPPGDARVLIATDPPVTYSERSGLLAAGLLLPPDLSEVDDVAFAGDGAHAVFTGRRLDAAGTAYQDAVVVDCAPSCRYVLVAPDVALHLAVSPSFGSDGTYFAFASQHIYVTHDGGTSMEAMAPPLPGTVGSIAMSPSYERDGRIAISAYQLDASLRPEAAVAVSTDGARSFRTVSSIGLPPTHTVSSMAMLPDGHILATLSGPDAAGLFGIRCSTDGGATWHLSC